MYFRTDEEGAPICPVCGKSLPYGDDKLYFRDEDCIGCSECIQDEYADTVDLEEMEPTVRNFPADDGDLSGCFS